MPNVIDLLHLGRDRVIAAHELDGGVIVDPGPASCADALLAGLADEPRALLLTHIHLDHAGASGVLARRFPELRVYVHELGAPHLVDTSKLLESAGRLYGDDLDRLWGEVAPVPAERTIALAVAGVAFAGAALGDVLVYVNTLATGKDGKELSHSEGKATDCARHVRGGSLSIQVTGKDTCGYRLPLEADKPQP